MYQGQVDYTAKIQGIIFEPFEIEGACQSVSRILLEATTEGNLKISFFVFDVESANDACRLTQGIVVDIIDKLSFELGVPISNPQLSGATVIQEIESGKGSNSKIIDVHGIDSLTFSCRVAVVKKLSSEPINNIRAFLEEQDVSHLRFFSVFRSALNNDDPVVRFMMLYKILLHKFGDNQREVDQFIRVSEPGVPETPRPDKPEIMETVYTRLRNEIGHVRPSAVPEQTRNEIAIWVNPLVGLVKKAIEQDLHLLIKESSC